MIPVLGLVGAGAPPALMCWVFLVPVAWGSVGVSNVAEQRQARARDLALGAPLRPVLWHPWMIGAIVAAGLFACMLGALLAVVAVTGDVGTSLVVAAAGSVVCGTFTLAWNLGNRNHGRHRAGSFSASWHNRHILSRGAQVRSVGGADLDE